MLSMKKIYRRVVSRDLRKFLYDVRGNLGLIPEYREAKKKEEEMMELACIVRADLESRKENLRDDEKIVYQYLLENSQKPVPVFPYNFTEEYNPDNVQVHRDKSGLPFVFHGDKKLYFKRDMSNEDVAANYTALCIEQDDDSPHCYKHKSDLFSTLRGVIADVGCAEANFSLDVVESAEKLYLFEGDSDWWEPLEATFSPWKDKVVIMKKWAGDEATDNKVCFDEFFASQRVDFIKMDVEGAEMEVLRGSKQILARDNPELIVCTYHKPDDSETIPTFLEEYPYQLSFMRGYMIFMLHDNQPPYLRRGVLRATRK